MASDLAGKPSTLPPDFQQAADPASAIIQPPRVMVSLPLDADLVAYFQNDAEPSDWQGHINGVLRFYMDSNLAMEADAELAAQIGQRQDIPKP